MYGGRSSAIRHLVVFALSIASDRALTARRAASGFDQSFMARRRLAVGLERKARTGDDKA